MPKVTHWIKNHQIVAFFILTFSITWGLGFSYDAVMKKNQFLLAPLVFVATCGPALAGIIITAISNSQPKQGPRKTYIIGFLAAWVVSASVFLAHNTFINQAPFNPVMVGFTLVSVVPVAFVISMAFSRMPALKEYLSSVIRLREVWGWAFWALIVTPSMILLSILISRILGRHHSLAIQYPRIGLPTLIGLVGIKFFYQLFFFNATGEEVGWRGFALPRLQALFSPLMAGLILSIFWSPWHFFLWRAEGQLVMDVSFWVEKYASHIPVTMLILWFYNRSKGSILVAGIVHAAANTAFAVVSNLDWQVFNILNVVVVLVIIIADRMWKKLSPDHPAIYKQV
jgi:membrane protease YdiL (CAAX protease family)